jgi:hypothetical protein
MENDYLCSAELGGKRHTNKKKAIIRWTTIVYMSLLVYHKVSQIIQVFQFTKKNQQMH